jgi:hypothetical protein
MGQNDSDTSPDELALALNSLRESGIHFRGPFATSRGTLVQIEDQILAVSELFDLFSKGQLTREGIQKFLSAQSKARAHTSEA